MSTEIVKNGLEYQDIMDIVESAIRCKEHYTNVGGPISETVVDQLKGDEIFVAKTYKIHTSRCNCDLQMEGCTSITKLRWK